MGKQLTKRKSQQQPNAEVLLAAVREDIELLPEVVRRLSEIARMTNDEEERDRIKSALDQLCTDSDTEPDWPR